MPATGPAASLNRGGCAVLHGVETLRDGFQAFGRDWHYVCVNTRSEQILGRKRAELPGRVVWEEFPEEVGTAFHARCLEAMETGRDVVFEKFCPRERSGSGQRRNCCGAAGRKRNALGRVRVRGDAFFTVARH